MIVTKTPLRISIGGGGTDLPSYYSRFGSTFISAAIDKHIYITFYRTFIDGIRLKYSRMEDVRGLEDIRHTIIRETFRLHGVNNNAEMASHADLPGGTGLGSSGSFGVGLSHALFLAEGKTPSPEELAEESTKVQMEILNYPIGKQDQYVGAFGGLNVYEISKDGAVTVTPLNVSAEKLKEFNSKLFMFFTGISRSANEILITQKEKSDSEDAEMTEILHQTQKLGIQTKDALEAGDFKKYAEIMLEHWESKKKRSAKMSSPQIDEWYELGLKNGAASGKLIGAGGGGFLLFYSDDGEKLISAMEGVGLRRVPFSFESEGSKVLVNE